MEALDLMAVERLGEGGAANSLRVDVKGKKPMPMPKPPKKGKKY